MATFVFVDATNHVHGYDFTGDSNKVTLKPSVDGQDSTVFGTGGYRSRKGGLRTVEYSIDGYWDSAPDAQGFADLGVVDRAVTVCASGSVETSIAYLFQAGQFDYEAYGNVGDMTPFSVSMMSTNKVGMVRGQMAKSRANVSATGATGTACNLGAGGAGKFLYSTLHLFSVGTTITVIVQSDDNSGMTTPTTVATIGPLTSVGGTFMTRVDASAITDNWFRFNVSAITGTFSMSGAIGVQ